MTTPYERTKSVLGTREFLRDLVVASDDLDVERFRGRAQTLLRHFPERVDLQISARFAPSVWADPAAKWND
jgi:hypothetical protein